MKNLVNLMALGLVSSVLVGVSGCYCNKPPVHHHVVAPVVHEPVVQELKVEKMKHEHVKK